MKTHRMILYWKGFLPILAELPEEEVIWDRVECFMDSVRKMGCTKKMPIAQG
jgi:hypothetical protein